MRTLHAFSSLRASVSDPPTQPKMLITFNNDKSWLNGDSQGKAYVPATFTATETQNAPCRGREDKPRDAPKPAKSPLPSQPMPPTTSLPKQCFPDTAPQAGAQRDLAAVRCRNAPRKPGKAHRGRAKMHKEMTKEEERARKKCKPNASVRFFIQDTYDSAIRSSRSKHKPQQHAEELRRLKDTRPESIILLDEQLTRDIGDVFA